MDDKVWDETIPAYVVLWTIGYPRQATIWSQKTLFTFSKIACQKLAAYRRRMIGGETVQLRIHLPFP
jgi:hypothetical protein